MKKSKYPLFETLCIRHGSVQHLEEHQNRFTKSYRTHYGTTPLYGLLDGLLLPQGLDPQKKYKLKISYGAAGSDFEITPYEKELPKTLKLVNADHLEYACKWTDRGELDALYAQRGEAMDVLIVKNGLLTDSTYANILLTDGQQIVTPAQPLLKGCCRARLLARGHVSLDNVTIEDLTKYHHFQLINAMNEFDDQGWCSITQIIA